MSSNTRQQMFNEFRDSLYLEDPRAFFEFEKMLYALQARLQLSEPEALELACVIVIGPAQERSPAARWIGDRHYGM